MGNILLISENDETFQRFKRLFATEHNFTSCCNSTSVLDLAETSPLDVVIIDEVSEQLNLGFLIKKIKTKIPNINVLFFQSELPKDSNILRYINGFITRDFSDDLIIAAINTHIKNKQQSDILSEKNKELSDSLYKLNVLYSTSSQFAGTLDTKKLLDYMAEGLDKSLSFDLTSTLSFGFENEPVLIIHSLYDISEEIMNALKLRAVLNYKSLFENKQPPFEIDDKNLKIIKYVKNQNNRFTFSIFNFDNMFAPIDLGDNFFGCIEIFKEKAFTTDDASYFQTIVQQVSLPLKSAELYGEINKQNEELKKLEHEKSEFLSIGSHELRTPLTPLKSALSILSSGRCGQLSDNAVKFVNMAKKNVEDLTDIINGILDINKIEAGKMECNRAIIDIHPIIEDVKNNFDGVAKEHSINFSTFEQENLPLIYADLQQISRVLTNLVSNAIKFTPEGKSITIKSELKNAADIEVNDCFNDELQTLNGDYVVVSVADEGIGIKDENLLKVFEKFTQIENTLSRKVGGTGLGLPIAKQLIKAHNGIIWCNSEEGKGSAFCFAIPVADTPSKIERPEKELV